MNSGHPLSLQQALNLAVQHHKSGQFQPAEALYRQILAQQPNHPDALYLLGVLAHQVGRIDLAVNLISRATVARPAFPDAFGRLAVIFCDLGRIDEAIAACRQAITLAAHVPEFHMTLGRALRASGRLDEAILAYRQVLSLSPDLADAHSSLGTVLREKGLLDEAIVHLKRAVEQRPGDGIGYLNLGSTLSLKREFTGALAAHRQAVALLPKDARTHEALGDTLLRICDAPAAEANLRQAIALDPGSARRWNSLGNALNFQGKFLEASACFRRALAISPEARFFRELISTGRGVANSAEIEDLKALANRPQASLKDRIEAHFALGKSYDDCDWFDEAFGHFTIANRLVKDSGVAGADRFDAEALRRQVDQLIETFTRQFFADRRGWGDGSEVPTFIVGMPRSGSSLVEQIAASHSAVFGAGELDKIAVLAARLRIGESGVSTGETSVGRWPERSIATAAAEYLEHLRSLAADAARIIDKMPANIFHLGLIALLFPRARVIFCRRDPRDNCLSCFFQRFGDTNLLYAYDLMDCARQYLQTSRLTEHWLKALPLKMLEIQYESLVADQEAQSRRLIEFLSLPWEPACLEFHRNQRPVLTVSFWQVRQPIFTRSIGRWRYYQQHLGPLLEMLEGHW